MTAGLEVVWASFGALDQSARATLAADVDPAQLARIERFHRQADRDRGLVAHALLRRELGSCTGRPPATLSLPTRCAGCGSTEHGKPHLPDREVEFNLSHSGRFVAVALAPPGSPVGVDVEVRRPVDWVALRRSVFGEQEWASTAAAADPDAARFQVWARKEAVLKASGHGLALGLRRVEIIGPGPAEPPDSWSARLPDGATARGWDPPLEADEPAAAAVAVLGWGGSRPTVRRVGVT